MNFGAAGQFLMTIYKIWETNMKKTIITVVGKDKVGIIAKVCTYLANNKINILDISQTIIDGFFNMMMITDTTDAEKVRKTSGMSSTRSVRRSVSVFMCSMRIYLR